MAGSEGDLHYLVKARAVLPALRHRRLSGANRGAFMAVILEEPFPTSNEARPTVQAPSEWRIPGDR
jgi:hypothetical protein